MQTCRTCRDNKERLYVDLGGFDGFLQEEIEEWVVDSLRKDLKRALHYEEVLSLEKLLTEEQILAINSRIREAERQFESADLNALYIDIINILEHTGHHELGVPCQGANPC